MNQEHSTHARRGFTLIELLVVIGIIGLLVSILLPTLSAARRRASDITCASQLRQLVAATTMYLNERHTYPEPGELPAFGGPVPLAIDQRLLNELARYGNWHDTQPSMTVLDLPPVVVCPLRRNVEALLEYNPTLGAPYWNTGYSYCGGIGQSTSPGAAVLMPPLISDRKGVHRGVLWADNMVLLDGVTAGGWGYFHFVGPHVVDPTFATVIDPVSYRGHHRAWSDGSVEWIRRGDFSFVVADADTAAAYKITGPTGLRLHHYW